MWGKITVGALYILAAWSVFTFGPYYYDHYKLEQAIKTELRDTLELWSLSPKQLNRESRLWLNKQGFVFLETDNMKAELNRKTKDIEIAIQYKRIHPLNESISAQFNFELNMTLEK